MGVHGLWRLIEPSGKPVPLETLENKVLAVDVSIWLHQAVKGFQDSRGAPLPNAHLLGIYHRVCKLLYFRVKPVFVFDGGVPALKKQTIAKRNQSKSRNLSEADRIQKQLLSTLLKHTALNKVLSEKIEASLISKTSTKNDQDNMYVLPPAQLNSSLSSSEDDSSDYTSTTDSSPTKHWDLHNIDMQSSHFKSLPVDVRHEILTDLKETRKQSSWGRLHELPKQSDNFAIYQMRRLLKRQAVQTALEDAEKEMGGHSLSLGELESLLKDQGVITNQNVGKRIASDENTRYLLVKDMKKALEQARRDQLKLEDVKEDDKKEEIEIEETSVRQEKEKNKADVEFEEDLQIALSMSLQDEAVPVPSTSSVSKNKDLEKALVLSLLDQPSTSKEAAYLEFSDANFYSSSSDEELDIEKQKTLSSAQNYMMEYSGLTPSEIEKIVGNNGSKKGLKKLPKKIETGNVEDKKVEAVSNEKQQKDEEIMSTGSDFSDDLVEVTEDNDENKSGLEIIVDPNKELNNDEDIFADVFTETNKEIGNNQLKLKAIEVVVNPTEEFKDDLFSDIFKQENKTEKDIMVVSDNKTIVVGKETAKKIEKIDAEDKVSKKEKIIYNIPLFKDEVLKIKESSSEINKKEFENNKLEPLIDKARNEELKQTETKVLEKPKLTVEQLQEMKSDLQKEKVDLLIEKSNKERLASNITDQMYQEAQELLQLFGVPYVVAPMEAEAQCAFLDEINLTDGTITDDSDIWLFGGKTVYKNFFNQSKYVMEFQSENIQHHFKLTREQMILLALLVGSDYTTGIQGVGPVTALEILAAFPPSKAKEFSLSHKQLISGLSEFRSWFTKDKTPGPGRTSLKSKLKNVTFTDSFPSLQVVQAYLEPKVETSRDTFSWGKPDIVGLTDFARDKFGWTRKKTEEILNPVIKRLQEHQLQKSIKDFFKTKFKVDSGTAEGKMSKRVKTAINNIGKDPSKVIAEEFEDKPKQKRTRKTKGKEIDSGTASKQRRIKKTAEENGENVTAVKSKQRTKISTKDYNTSVETVTKQNITKSKVSEDTEEIPKSKEREDKNKETTDRLVETKTKIKPKQTRTKKHNKETDKADVEKTTQDEVLAKITQIRTRRKLKAAAAVAEPKKPKARKKNEIENIPEDLQDQEINILQQTMSHSLIKIEEINIDVQKEIERTLNPKQKTPLKIVHKKEVIPQKERDKSDSLRNKLKAIEVFRKGKKGPGFVSKTGRKKRKAKENADLSEESD